MAKEESKILSPEEQKREKELKQKEKEEKALIAKMQKEKEQKRKLKEKRIKEERKQEIKRIKTLINLPFKLLLHLSLLATMMMSIILYFWLELDLKTTLIYLFLIFTFFYFGIGIIMVAAVLMISEDKKKELEELQRIEREREEIETQRLREAEEAKLQILERDLASMRSNEQKGPEMLASMQEAKQIPPVNQNESESITDEMSNLIEDSNEQFSLPETSISINEDLNDFAFEQEQRIVEEQKNEDIDYLNEIMK